MNSTTNKAECEILPNGVKEWRLDGMLHREDGPAVEWTDGAVCWYRKDRPHRKGGPAYIGTEGHLEWYRNGKLHNEDGPAVVWPDGTKEWYINDFEYDPIEWMIKVHELGLK